MVVPDLYWLCRCEGWRVVSPEGRVGSVVRLLFGSSANVPDAIVVRTGLFRVKEVILPAAAVVATDADRRTLTLYSGVASSEFPAILEARRAAVEGVVASSSSPQGDATLA